MQYINLSKKKYIKLKDTRSMAHGPHCSPEKQFQSISTFAQRHDYTITLIDI